MIRRQTIAAIITTTALAYSICTPTQAANLVAATQAGVAGNCADDKHTAPDATQPAKPAPAR